MSLSTSNSKNEFKTCLAVLAVLMLLELVVHTYQNHLSGDVVHLSTIPTIAESFRDSKAGKILFLGNSLTREGVNVPVVRERFAGGPLGGVNWQKVHPDDTNIVDWYYLYKNWFYRSGSSPDVLIVGFARNYLTDSAAMHPDELAIHFGGLRNVPEVFESDITDSSGRVNYLLASVSTLYGNRRRISLRIADALIPDYRATAAYFNQFVRFNVSLQPENGSSNYRRLSRLAELCRLKHTLLVAVAMPIANDYEIDTDLTKALADSGSVFIDLRRVDGIDKRQYSDTLHLNSSGAVIYSRALAQALQDQAHLEAFLGSRDRLTAGN